MRTAATVLRYLNCRTKQSRINNSVHQHIPHSMFHVISILMAILVASHSKVLTSGALS